MQRALECYTRCASDTGGCFSHSPDASRILLKDAITKPPALGVGRSLANSKSVLQGPAGTGAVVCAAFSPSHSEKGIIDPVSSCQSRIAPRSSSAYLGSCPYCLSDYTPAPAKLCSSFLYLQIKIAYLTYFELKNHANSLRDHQYAGSESIDGVLSYGKPCALQAWSDDGLRISVSCEQDCRPYHAVSAAQPPMGMNEHLAYSPV